MRKGSKHHPETISRISQSKKGCISPNKGKIFNQEWRDNLRKSHLGHGINENQRKALDLGRKIHADMVYVEGVTNDPKYRNWQKRLNSYRRREAARLFGNAHTNEEWEGLKEKYNYSCPSCNLSEPEIKLTRDHIISLSKGGSDSIDNIQPLCKTCNCRKHTKNIRY